MLQVIVRCSTSLTNARVQVTKGARTTRYQVRVNRFFRLHAQGESIRFGVKQGVTTVVIVRLVISQLCGRGSAKVVQAPVCIGHFESSPKRRGPIFP
jgi:hypothetical protein